MHTYLHVQKIYWHYYTYYASRVSLLVDRIVPKAIRNTLAYLLTRLLR